MSDKEKIEAVKKHLKKPFLLEVENGKLEKFSFSDKFINMYTNEELLKLYKKMNTNGVLP